ncbi:MAG: glutamyl-tRNA reductase [Proteobacteria bacterium]|nr:glutamyl-tRNA reductase [Pseudomonadota bacterium]
MTEIVLLGLNHKTAPVALREQLAFSGEEVHLALDILREIETLKETILISTCNRMEILFTTEEPDNCVSSVLSTISDFKSISLEQFEKSIYVYQGDEAVSHIFKVAASLDSMVLGEPQILGQVKDAYRVATEKKISGVILNRLLHRTFNVAKRIRSETGIGDSAVSISYAAVELARKIFGNLDEKKVLLVGAGEMAELAVEHLIRNKVEKIFVANRTFERAVSLSKRFHGEALKFEEIIPSLEHVDIIVSSTGAPGFIIKKEDVKKILKSRRSRSLFFIDIAVPRDIDPDINKLSNAYVYDIDDLKNVIDENLEERQKEALKAERIVDEAVIRFREWIDSLHVVPTIIALKNRLNDLAEGEFGKTLQHLKHLSEEDANAIHKMTDALINKILHDPIQLLKNSGDHRNVSMYLDFTRTLFRLDE